MAGPVTTGKTNDGIGREGKERSEQRKQRREATRDELRDVRLLHRKTKKGKRRK